MKPKLGLTKCELERDFSSVTSPLADELRYPVMESNENPCKHNKVTDWQGTLEKSLWQWSPNGRDFRKFTVRDKDELNLQIQKHLVEDILRNELIIENLEQCTEDHDCDQMNRGLTNENQCHEESEYEETEHKLFLAGGMFLSGLDSEDDRLAPEVDEKSDVEKEKGEKDGEEKDYYEKDGKEKQMDINEITTKHGDEKEADDKKKSENEEAEKELTKRATDKNSSDQVKTIDYHSRVDVAAGETAIDSGFFEIEVLTENPEDGQLELIDRCEVTESQAGLEVEEYWNTITADPVQMERELTQMETKEQSALVLTLDSYCPEDVTFDVEMSGNADSLMPAFLTIKSSFTGVSPMPIEEEMSGSCMDSDVIRKEELQKQLEGVLIANGAEMVPSDIQPMSLQIIERKWKNISNYTVTRVGQEPVNSEQHRGRSGDRSGKSSQGNCGNGGGGGTACGSSREGCLTMTGNPSSGGLGSGCGGGGGDEDGDKSGKENFRFSDVTDERKTKQEKELKKKSKLEKGDLCSYPIVSYGDKEKLRAMAVEWGERSEHRRHNSSYARHHSEGVILDSYQNKFFIHKNRYQENVDWAKATGTLSPLGCGTSGKCYPCADLKTGKLFCIKEMQLINFYDSEITILLDLDNPGIVKLYGAIFSDDKVYILLELICGPTLQEEIERNEKLDCLTALKCTRQLLEVLDYLEKCGVIHDDVKADNIMFREGSIVLIDFGLAKKVLQVQEGSNPCGSQCGMSPEKAASEGYNSKADVWAATTLLVHMLSGNVPWTIKERSPPLEDVPSDTPEAVRSLIETGWIVDADRRPSASQLLTCEAFQLLDTSLPSDELIHKFSWIDEHTTLENFDLEDGEELIMEAEEMLLSENLDIGAIDDDKTLDNLEGATSTGSLLGLFGEPEEVSSGSPMEYSDDQKRQVHHTTTYLLVSLSSVLLPQRSCCWSANALVFHSVLPEFFKRFHRFGQILGHLVI